MPNLTAVVMAAGKGTRMKSKLPKVMHMLAGKPLIGHVMDTVHQVGIEDPLVILGHGREPVEEEIAGRAKIVVQEEQLGTGHAILQALPFLDGVEDILVLSGDQPLLKPETLLELIKLHKSQEAAATVLAAYLDEPFGYGRIIQKEQQLVKIVEEKDATSEQRLIKAINTGTYCFKVGPLREALGKITPQNAQGEYYLTEVFDILLEKQAKILIHTTGDSDEALGINSRSQLAEAERIYRRRILEYWMAEGVTIIDPGSTFIDAEVQLAQDVTLLPFTVLKGRTKIAEDALIGPNVLLEDCSCAGRCEILHTVARQAVIGDGCTVGPFAYLRPGTELGNGVKVGDFVEIKNSKVGPGSKIPHLSYIGDAQVGQSVNIGAGAITCNYDGVEKHPTVIGDHVFIGSNANLVAPVHVGNGAFVGAGSTITKDVPAQALSVERSHQVIKENWRR